MSIEISHALMTDDVREEVSGKTTLVGVYNNNITISSLPALLPKICFVIGFKSVSDESEKIKFVLRSPSGRVIQSSNGPTFGEAMSEIGADKFSSMVFSYSPLTLDELGEFELVYVGGSDEQVVYSFEVLNK